MLQTEDFYQKIREKTGVIITNHFMQRMEERAISEPQIIRVLQNKKVVRKKNSSVVLSAGGICAVVSQIGGERIAKTCYRENPDEEILAFA